MSVSRLRRLAHRGSVPFSQASCSAPSAPVPTSPATPAARWMFWMDCWRACSGVWLDGSSCGMAGALARLCSMPPRKPCHKSCARCTTGCTNVSRATWPVVRNISPGKSGPTRRKNSPQSSTPLSASSPGSAPAMRATACTAGSVDTGGILATSSGICARRVPSCVTIGRYGRCGGVGALSQRSRIGGCAWGGADSHLSRLYCGGGGVGALSHLSR